MNKENAWLFYLNTILIGLVIACIYLLVSQQGSRPPNSTDNTLAAASATPQTSSDATVNNPMTPAALSGMTGPVSYAQAVEKASDAVISIYTAKTVQRRQTTGNAFFDQFFGDRLNRSEVETGSGSGVIFNEAGYIITNYHVIKDVQQMRVLLKDGRDFPATIVGSDPETDLAVLRIIAEGLKPISLSSMETIAIGDVVLAIGNPFGVGQTVTMGIVSATGRDRVGLNTFENFIQTDAAINPGNSGGALIDANGRLVGINTAIFSRSGGSLGIGFAIPANMAKDVLDQILENGQVKRGWLGVEASNMSDMIKTRVGTNGIVVTGVYRGGPADQAGLLPGDILTHINSIEISSIHDILKVVTPNQPGDTVSIEGIRDGTQYETKATLDQRPVINN